MLQPETRILRREGISAALTEALMRYPLVVLTAPLGYGKTTAARALMRIFPRRAVYIAMPMESHNPFYLWDRACGQAIAQDAKVAGALQRMGFPSDPAQVRKALDRLRAGTTKYPVLVIIDDYHYVDIPALDAFIEAAARESIPGLSVLLLSRSRPRMALEELRLKGLAARFGHEFLAFTEEDAVSYFALNGITDEQTAKKARSRAEGWPAALWLNLQNCITNGVPPAVPDMEEILRHTVYSKYGEADKKLLLQLSIFESFTPRQAVSVTEDESAPRRLHALHDQNALIAHDPATDSYRLHSIFRTFLERVLFDRMDPPVAVDLPSLYRRAGEWYALDGDFLQALGFFFKAGDDEGCLKALDLLENPESAAHVLLEPGRFLENIQKIPWGVKRRRPLGYLSFLYHFTARTDREAGSALAEEAEKEFLQPGGMPEELRRRVKGELELIHGMAAFNDFAAMGEKTKNAYALLGGKSAIAARDLGWTLGCPHLAFNYLRKEGGYDALLRLADDIWPYFREVSDCCAVGARDLFLAEQLLERYSLKKAEQYALKAVYRANAREQFSTLIAGYFAQARLSLALGRDAADAMEALDELKIRIMRANNPLPLFSLDLVLGYMAAVRNQPENVPTWLRRGDASVMPRFYQCAGFINVVHGKTLLAEARWPALEALAQDMSGDAGAYDSLMLRIHAKIMHAVAARHLHGESEAKPVLAEALRLARPDKLTLMFAEYGPHITPLFATRKNSGQDAFAAGIKKACAVYAKKGKNAALGLAPRETAVLELAVSGKLNNEIAAALGIKPVTVGNTLSRVYRKLGVQNRTEAALVWSRR